VTTLGSVLIVEDDFALRQGLRNTLEAVGFCPREASSGEEALLALRHHQFETILLDINMPGIGGMEACRRIRQMYPLLQILVLTVRDEEKDKIEALDAGADDYVTKPFQFLELTAFQLPTSILSERGLLLLVRAQGRHLWGVASWC
jgi:two-component system KDP operon response regulator KdpE